MAEHINRIGFKQLMRILISVLVILAIVIIGAVFCIDIVLVSLKTKFPIVESIPLTEDINSGIVYVTAEKVYQDYIVSPEFAKEYYQGKRIKVQGILVGFALNDKGEYRINLSTSADSANILCCFSPAYQLLEIEVQSMIGQLITVTGICNGMQNNLVVLKPSFSCDLPIEPDSITVVCCS